MMKKSLLISLLMLLVTLPVVAQQYKYEVGPSLGMTGYLGEANNGVLFKHPSFTVGGLSWYPDGANYVFSSHLIDLGLTAEFNFLNYGRGPAYKKYKPISPYMVAGVGFVFAICDGRNQASFTIPIGIGVKYKFKERLNLGLEFTMRKEFSDRIDGISDLYGIKHSFAKNTDWYSFVTLTATYEFGERCIKCNYIE